MKNKTKVAIAGLGFGESVHLPALKSNNNLEPIALWHPNKSKLDESCKRNNLIGFDKCSELLKKDDIKGR